MFEFIVKFLIMSLKRSFDGFGWELYQDKSNEFHWHKSSNENGEVLLSSKKAFKKKKECIVDAESSGCPADVIIHWKTTPFS
ncbi:hypothetical protein DMA11_07450 [Marinilabiliaceae bacterium JC017]|nr:hypothetical protein DMA11_07450 [Marinilabiliaceae bacterium JC017]